MDADEHEDYLCDFVRETQKHILQAVFGRPFDLFSRMSSSEEEKEHEDEHEDNFLQVTQKHILQAVFGDNRVVWVASFRPICINLQFLADSPTSP